MNSKAYLYTSEYSPNKAIYSEIEKCPVVIFYSYIFWRKWFFLEWKEDKRHDKADDQHLLMD